ncbi:MAG: hypothetical protein FJ029_01190 [Actinobacteria bacterium]|nr:hypothetical protein [Actinomycetota bacterium]
MTACRSSRVAAGAQRRPVVNLMIAMRRHARRRLRSVIGAFVVASALVGCNGSPSAVAGPASASPTVPVAVPSSSPTATAAPSVFAPEVRQATIPAQAVPATVPPQPAETAAVSPSPATASPAPSAAASPTAAELPTPVPTAVPDPTPLPTVPPLPTVTPKPARAFAEVGRIIVTREVDQFQRPIGTASDFRPRERVYISVEFRDVREGAVMGFRWTNAAGVQGTYETEPQPSSARRGFWAFSYDEGELPGQYRIEILVNGVALAETKFVIRERGTQPEPTPTPRR